MISESLSFHSIFWGVVTGAFIGMLFCWYLYKTWDPVTLKSKGGCGATLSGCLLPIVTVGSVIGGRLISSMFDADFIGWFLGTAIAMMYVMIGYLVIQVLRYRPR